MNKYLIALGISLLIFLGIFQGCQEKPKYSDLEWEAGSMFLQGKPGVCRHRVAILASKMIKNKKCFDLIFGDIGTEKHVRLEVWSGKVLLVIDPSQYEVNYSKFVETNRITYTPRGEDDTLSQIGRAHV